MPHLSTPAPQAWHPAGSGWMKMLGWHQATLPLHRNSALRAVLTVQIYFFPNFCKKTHTWKLPLTQLPPQHTWIKHHRLCIHLIMTCDFCCIGLEARGRATRLGSVRKYSQSQSQKRPRKAVFPSAWLAQNPSTPSVTLSQQEGAGWAHSSVPTLNPTARVSH